MRFALLLVAVGALGCVATPVRHDWPSRDRDRDQVREAVGPVFEPSVERHVRDDRRVVDQLGFGGSHDCGGKTEWWGTFGYRTPDGRARDITAEEARQILNGLRVDLLAAVEATGAEVIWAPPAEVGDGPNPEGRFRIRYLRKLRDGSGEVSGELVGRLIACPGPADPTSQVRVTLNERLGK